MGPLYPGSLWISVWSQFQYWNTRSLGYTACDKLICCAPMGGNTPGKHMSSQQGRHGRVCMGSTLPLTKYPKKYSEIRRSTVLQIRQRTTFEGEETKALEIQMSWQIFFKVSLPPPSQIRTRSHFHLFRCLIQSRSLIPYLVWATPDPHPPTFLEN